MDIVSQLQQGIAAGLKSLYDHEVAASELGLQPTRKEFEGTYTFVTFPYGKISKKNPVETGEELGSYLRDNCDVVAGYNVVKGFLNIELSTALWANLFNEIAQKSNFGSFPRKGETVMVEYSSPNTNKPLHLGHLRNIFLGYSVSKIYDAFGYDVVKVQIINDRGIHICKSMVAWQRFGNGETPETSGLKGDKLVGKYYVEFDKAYKAEISELVAAGQSQEEAEKQAPLLLEAQELLRKWEAKEPDTYALWEQMNGWVYKGFDATYEQMGVTFDKLYYESNTYLLGKEQVAEGLKAGHFFAKDDGSVWVDLTEEGLDQKIVQRSDGTAVYMTQDIGTAIQRFKEYPGLIKQVYTVGNEQDYHFKVLFLILKKLGYKWAEECYHLSYGMVDLPSGKMKSREGTVVDADDLMGEMIATAAHHTKELGKIDGFTDVQANELYDTIGLGALKYFLLKVDPKKRMLFDPQESIEFHGNTGPFIQYTHARISAIIRRAKELAIETETLSIPSGVELSQTENELIYLLSELPNKVKMAAEEYLPSVIAQYVYDLAKEYNKFYAEFAIFGEQAAEITASRVALSAQVAKNIKYGMSLLGIHVPDRM
ncbi:arginine--tRNA ligase [Reichenbachiella carrageenanivorans]|uniref:Arginine--tRNA ligase n=1 Tax=Reichenbachiella carrageenanivorans TaxID=2979869 RepID=A0ABY6D7C8_9BACT|nr:arginine--tRNA ligase [Reichenbachiella carrageenanivorans]UXX79745.1 arginine--tRNA ligase [Reichenbachiella carrageenanivorans]